MQNDFISTTQAAEMLGASRVTVFNMIKDGRIDAIKVGRNYIIHKNFRYKFVEDIAKKIVPVLKKYGVKRAGIFGSTACGMRHKNSDLDLLIEYRSRKSLMDLVKLQFKLEDYLGMKVDLLTYDSIHHLLKDIILKQELPIL